MGGVSCAGHHSGCSGLVGGWEAMGFEELLDQVGGFGPFQLWNVALLALPRLLLPLHFLLPIFLAAVPAHRCALPGAPANFSHPDAWLEAHLPQESDGSFSSCLRFTYPKTLPNATWGREGQSPGEPDGAPSTVPCPQGWEYDRSEFSSTIATEVHLNQSPEVGGHVSSWGTRDMWAVLWPGRHPNLTSGVLAGLFFLGRGCP